MSLNAGNKNLVPRYNWDYGLKELATALGSILIVGPWEEDLWEEVFGCKPILTTSGRASLYTILKALELPKGSGVGVPLFCCNVVFDAVRQAGLVPVFLDINNLGDSSYSTYARMPVARSTCSVPRVAENCVLGGLLTFYEGVKI